MKTTEKRRPNRWFRDFWRLAKPFWISEKRASAILLLGGVLIGAVTAVYYNVLFTRNNGAFINSIANRSKTEFYHALLEYVAIGVLWIVVGMTGHYLKYRLKLMWREWMTRRFLELWFKSQRHYFWNLTQKKDTDNPDQRIAEDIKIFINTTETLTIDLFVNILTLFTYGAPWPFDLAVDPRISALALSRFFHDYKPFGLLGGKKACPPGIRATASGSGLSRHANENAREFRSHRARARRGL